MASMKALVHRARGVAPLPGWYVVSGLYVVAVVLTVARFRQWGPDSRFYLAWAYRYGGLSEQEAGRRTYEFLNSFSWFKPFCYGGCDTTDPTVTYDWLFHGRQGSMVASRIFYPLLSAPFVRLFGPTGMLVVPLLAYTLCVVLVMVLASRLVGPRWAPLAGVAIVLPITVSRWSTYAYTEALAMLFLMACVLVLPLGRRTGRRDLTLFGAFFLLFAFTRQFHPIVVAGVALAWLGAALFGGRLRNDWLPFLAVAVGLTLLAGAVQSWMGPGYSVLSWFLEQSGAKTWSGVPGAIPGVVGPIITGEIWDIGADFGLVAVLLAAALGLVYRYRSALAHLTLGVVLGTFFLHILNTEPSHFRYYATAMPLLAVMAAAAGAEMFGNRSEWGSASPSTPAPAASVTGASG